MLDLSVPQVVRLHTGLRDCCDLMGIGLGDIAGGRDTVAEDDVAAGPRGAAGGKDAGDVRWGTQGRKGSFNRDLWRLSGLSGIPRSNPEQKPQGSL